MPKKKSNATKANEIPKKLTMNKSKRKTNLNQ